MLTMGLSQNHTKDCWLSAELTPDGDVFFMQSK